MARQAQPELEAFMQLIGFRSWDADWRSFKVAQPIQAERTTGREPYHCLPRAAIDDLAKPRGKSPPLLGEAQAQAEGDFTLLCERYKAAGCWSEWPVLCPVLNPPPAKLNLSQYPGRNWTRAAELQAQNALKGAADRALRLKGYAGWLLTEPAFIADMDALRAAWNKLPGRQRLTFPLQRTITLPWRVPAARAAAPSTVDFGTRLNQFLDRWGLTQMTTWDLPSPQGPLLSGLIPGHSPSMPKHGVHLILPTHYPLQDDDGLVKQIL